MGASVAGSRIAELASGISSMSDSEMPCQPRIEDPSKPRPSSNADSVERAQRQRHVLPGAEQVAELEVDHRHARLASPHSSASRASGIVSPPFREVVPVLELPHLPSSPSWTTKKAPAALNELRGAVASASAFRRRNLPQQRSIGRGWTPAARGRLTLVATILGSGIALLDSTVVNVALPAIEDDLGGGLAGQQWVVNAYLLTLGSLILSAARWGTSTGSGGSSRSASRASASRRSSARWRRRSSRSSPPARCRA